MVQAILKQIGGINEFLVDAGGLGGGGGWGVVVLGRDEPTPTVSPFLLLPNLPISADHDACSVKHTPCGNGVTSPIVLYKHNVPELPRWSQRTVE